MTPKTKSTSPRKKHAAAKRDPRRGLVLAGGAALGAYQGGALKSLREHHIEFDIIAATSVGVVHALAWNYGDLILSIEDHWHKNVEQFAPFDLKRLLNLENPFRFRHSLNGLFDKYRSGYLSDNRRTQVPIIVSLTEVVSGQNAAFFVTPVEHLTNASTLTERENILKASTIIPALGDEPIEIQGRRYYDGGFSNNLPINFLEDRDLDEIWVIRMLPPYINKKWKAVARRAVMELRGKTVNPWVLGVTGLAGQILNPEEAMARIQTKKIIIRPTSRNVMGHLPLIGALTFAHGNIERLLRLGYEDGRQACEKYKAGQSLL